MRAVHVSGDRKTRTVMIVITCFKYRLLVAGQQAISLFQRSPSAEMRSFSGETYYFEISNVQLTILGILVSILVASLLAYFYLGSVLARTDQVLVVWEKVAGIPIVGKYSGQICTMFLKIRNPYTRSIGFSPMQRG